MRLDRPHDPFVDFVFVIADNADSAFAQQFPNLLARAILRKAVLNLKVFEPHAALILAWITACLKAGQVGN
jgi:hypothetical protein